MKYVLKSLLVCMVTVFVLAFFCLPTMAQITTSIWHLPAFYSQPLVVPTISPTTGDILADNFEYWDSPYNHGWIQLEPAYPVYGYGFGYATRFNTVLDLQEGSRVLDVYRPASVFLLGTNYGKHFIIRDFTAIGGINIDRDNPPANGVMSFKFRAPLGIESWDIFEFDVLGTTKNGGRFIIQIRPVQPPYGSSTIFDGTSTESINPYLATMIQEGDLSTDAPDLFEPGPLYAQIFEPYRYLFFADYAGNIIGENVGARITDIALDPTNFITDPNEIRDTWIEDLLAIDPNYHQLDPNSAQYNPDYTKGWIPGDPNYGKPDPLMELYLRDGFSIDSTLPSLGILT